MAELILPSLEVKLDCYEGPLWVLLKLIKNNRLSIWNVPISQIVDRFLEYVEVVRQMNLRIVEDFIEIASLLIVIKSRMLLSSDEEKELGEEELLERVYEYEKTRKLALSLDTLPILNRDTFIRKGDGLREDRGYDLYLLLKAFFELVRQKESFIEIKPIKPTLEERLSFIEDRLLKKGIYIFDVAEDGDLSEKIATVLSMLEIVKRKVARLIQHRPFGKIILKRRNGIL
ncbi:MAG: segregation/condensation protein A [Deltaproteobacteria bacterium]|nr:segregation/condensation protein A [Deltaproteobacteria bacterium]